MAIHPPRSRAWRRWRDSVRLHRALVWASNLYEGPTPTDAPRWCGATCDEHWHAHTWDDVHRLRRELARRWRDDSKRRTFRRYRNHHQRQCCTFRWHEDERINRDTWEQVAELEVRQDAVVAPRRSPRT